MLAMPISSSSSTKDLPPPCLTFHGPDKTDTVFIQNPDGSKSPIFAVQVSKHSKPQFQIYKILPNGTQQPFCTGNWESMREAHTLHFNDGQEVLFKMNMSGTGRAFEGPVGKLTWKSDGMGYSKLLVDESKKTLAKYSLKDDMKLDFFVTGDERFIDLVIATSVALWVRTARESSDMKAGLGAFKLITTLAGLPSN